MTDVPSERTSRRRWPARRIHRWIGVSVGVCIFAWTFTGLVRIAPVAGRNYAPSAVDYAALTIAPARAVEIARAAHPDAAIGNVTLVRLAGRMAYQVGLRGRAPVLVDAADGQSVTVTEDLAGRMVLDGLPAGTRIERITRIERVEIGYGGPLPAWRVDVADERGTRGYVGIATADLRRNDRSGRLRLFIGSFHEYFPLELLRGGDRVREPLLWVTSLIALAVVLTGWWIALPRRSRPAA